MSDEARTDEPQDKDKDEVEAHRFSRDVNDEPNDETDDEVEAHRFQSSPLKDSPAKD